MNVIGHNQRSLPAAIEFILARLSQNKTECNKILGPSPSSVEAFCDIKDIFSSHQRKYVHCGRPVWEGGKHKALKEIRYAV